MPAPRPQKEASPLRVREETSLHTPYRIIVPSEDRDRADLTMHVVAMRLGTPMEAIRHRGRLSRSAVRVRRVSVYLAHVAFGWPLERVGYAFGVNRQTVGTSCTRIEEAREHRDVNDLLEQLTETLQALCEAPPTVDLTDVA